MLHANAEIRTARMCPYAYAHRTSSTASSRHSSDVYQASMATDKEDVQSWDASNIFRGKASDKYACIILNQSIADPYKQLAQRIWENDGGANALFDGLGGKAAPPHEIRGDLDSIRPDVLAFYQRQKVKVTRAASLYATDLQKCILSVEEYEDEQSESLHEQGLVLVILGGLSGRLDQTMHTLHVLCQLSPVRTSELATMQMIGSNSNGSGNSKHTNKSAALNEEDYMTVNKRAKTLVISENSVAWLLSKGEHDIEIDQNIFGPTCGLLPFSATVQKESKSGGIRIWTKGLRWNLDGEVCAIGGFLSTSNHLQDDKVKVKTEGPIIWTMEIRT